MSVEKFIKDNVKELAEKVYISPEIPTKKLNNAISSMANEVNPDYVLAIADTSILGSAKEGCLFLGDAIYMRNFVDKPMKFSFNSISHAEYICEEKTNNNGKIVREEDVVFYFKDGNCNSVKPYIATGIDYKKLSDLINGIINENEGNEEYVSTSQALPLAMMDPEVQKAYIKIICNFAYLDNGIIDSKEYAELSYLMIRIELKSVDRRELRDYLLDSTSKISTDELISYLESNAEEGSLDLLKASLIKDLLYLLGVQSERKTWKENNFIREIQTKFNITTEQVEAIVDAIKSDEDILNERKNDSEIKKAFKETAAKAGAVGIPLAAIYLSGSVMGFSAAGITSGLATLGMGGLLGFSGMVTGIGVVVVVGIGAYKGIKHLTGISELENNKQREYMLQMIIRNSQKALNYLIEDVNELTHALIEEINKGEKTSAQISKLAGILNMLSQGAQFTNDRIAYSEKESVITNLPMKLDISRLEELTNEPTTRKVKDIIIGYYVETRAISEEGKEKVEYLLNENLNINNLEQLYNCFQSIGYLNVKDATVASVKGAIKYFTKSFVE